MMKSARQSFSISTLFLLLYHTYHEGIVMNRPPYLKQMIIFQKNNLDLFFRRIRSCGLLAHPCARRSSKQIQIIFLKYSILIISLFFINITSAIAAPTIEGIQVYQRNLKSPEHKQKLADDIDRYQNADNFWDVLRDEFSLSHYEDNPLVQEKIEWFMNNQGFLLRSAARAAPYLYYISEQVKKRHLPAELVLLPIIESGYNPFSFSNRGASGIWQLMPGTASDLGIKQNWLFDGRRDVIASTRGALNYLAYLQNFFEGNWLLAIAAYNTGEGNVLTAIRKNIRDGRDTDFWSLPVAQQTKDYVPSLLALAIIIANPDKYPIPFPPVHNAPYLAQIDIGVQMNLKIAAALAGLSYPQMQQLNPGFRDQTASTQFMLPIENVEQFSENFTRTPLSPKINWPNPPPNNHKAALFKTWANYKLQPGDTIYMIRAKDTLANIAKRFHVKISEVLATNQLRGKHITPGKQIIIPTHTRAQTQTNHSIQPGDTLYMVRRGDTLDSIASKFKTTASVIRVVNLLDEGKLQEGQRIVVPTHLQS